MQNCKVKVKLNSEKFLTFPPASMLSSPESPNSGQRSCRFAFSGQSCVRNGWGNPMGGGGGGGN